MLRSVLLNEMGDVMTSLDDALMQERQRGELLISQLRLVIVLLASVVPLMMIILNGAYLGLALVLLVLGYAAGIRLLLKRGYFSPWFGYLTLLCDAVGLGICLMLLSLIKPGSLLLEPLFAIYYIISVSGTIKYDFKYSFFSLVLCALMVFVLAWFDAAVLAIRPDGLLIFEKVLLLFVFTIISFIFHNLFTKIVESEHQVMHQRFKEISALMNIGCGISPRCKLEQSLQAIVEQTRDLLNSDICYLGFLEEGLDSFVACGLQQSLKPDGALENDLSADGTLIRSLAELEQRSGREATAYLRAEGVVSLVAAPIIIEGKRVGFQLAGRRSVEAYGEHDKVLLSALSQQAALTVQNSLLCEELENDAPRESLRNGYRGIVGRSAPMQKVFGLIEKSARTDLPVLLRGESGTGKELVARALHQASARSSGPFIPINCAAIPETLLESELFGHERGAFTGADRLKQGIFELAQGGTIFLDEIGDMSVALQIKLFRFLQSHELLRLGGKRTIRVDVRIISATNQDLEQKIAAGLFREDLFYRINTLTIFMPALRMIPEDIPLLVDHFMVVYGGRQHLSRSAMKFLKTRPWRGNVRELENLVQRMVAICDGELVRTAQLKELIAMMTPDQPADGALNSYLQLALGRSCSLIEETAHFERSLINEALLRSGGNISETGRLLNVPKSTLFNKIRKHGLL